MSIIGESAPKKDGPEKVSGTAKYSTDFSEANMLYAKMVISTYAHAKIRCINTGKALKMPGV